MKRLSAVMMFLLLAAPAWAHFVWLAPDDAGRVRMVFSEDAEPDAGVPVTKIAQAQVQVRTGGKVVPVEKTAAADHYLIALPGSGPAEVGAVCEYGVLAKKGDPYLLCYYAKTLVRGATPEGMGHPLEVFPVAGKADAFEVRWQARPLAGAEVVVEAPGADAAKVKTDAEGRVRIPAAKSGRVLVRAKHVEAKSGERAGQAFKEVRHYATLTVTR